jgi:hypothetical protein
MANSDGEGMILILYRCAGRAATNIAFVVRTQVRHFFLEADRKTQPSVGF